jgi:hypothetical protein
MLRLGSANIATFVQVRFKSASFVLRQRPKRVKRRKLLPFFC